MALLRTVSGIIVDRVNIAGNETGQQSNYSGKGSLGRESTWTLDGVVITDMSATGASPTYVDCDAFQEIQISTSNTTSSSPQRHRPQPGREAGDEPVSRHAARVLHQ